METYHSKTSGDTALVSARQPRPGQYKVYLRSIPCHVFINRYAYIRNESHATRAYKSEASETREHKLEEEFIPSALHS